MNFLEQHNRSLVVCFFLLFLAVGLFVYGDYGISWDEPKNRRLGHTSADYLRSVWQETIGIPTGEVDVTSTPLHEYRDRTYGVAVELPLFASEVVVGLTDTRDIYRWRHLLTFLLFYASTVFFYLIIIHRYGDWKWGLLGCAFLVLSPRIFANAFYNSKDLAFMALFIINLYTLLKFIEAKSMLTACVHGLVTALLIDTRIVGVFIPVITTMFYIATLAQAPLITPRIRNVATTLVGYLSVTVICVVLFWPFLWENPIVHFHESLARMSHYPWGGSVRYFGELIPATRLPWHYIPVWVGITTPLLYIVLFAVGALSIVFQFLSHPLKSVQRAVWQLDALFLCTVLLPIVAVIVLNSTLYDGWRQMYFVYPGIVLMSIAGLRVLVQSLTQLRNTSPRAAATALALLVLFSLSQTLAFMIRNHPHQNVYFNSLGSIQPTNFDLDYWGLSYKQALEYVAVADDSPEIEFAAANSPGYINVSIMETQDRARLKRIPLEEIEKAKFYLSNYRSGEWGKYQKGQFPYVNEVYKIEMDGIPIMGVYQLRK